jgi:hypothetical protein
MSDVLKLYQPLAMDTETVSEMLDTISRLTWQITMEDAIVYFLC